MQAFRSRRNPIEQEIDILPAERRPYPKPRPLRGGDVIDASYVVVTDTASRASEPRRPAPSAPRGDFARRRAGPAAAKPNLLKRANDRLSLFSARAFGGLVAVSTVSIFSLGLFLSWWSDGTAQPVAPLDITHATLTPQDANGMTVLAINAIIENRSGEMRDLPPVRAELIQEDGLLASILIEPPAPAIEGGESRGFTARLPHPGGKIPQLRLSFADRGAPTY